MFEICIIMWYNRKSSFQKAELLRKNTEKRQQKKLKKVMYYGKEKTLLGT